MRAVARFVGVLVSAFTLDACNRADPAPLVVAPAVEIRERAAHASSPIARRRVDELAPERTVDAGAAASTIAFVAPDAGPIVRAPGRVRGRGPRAGRASTASSEAAPLEVESPLEEPAGTEMVCARISQGVHVDPEDEAPCAWVRRPSCPGMFVVWHHDGGRLFGSCATTMPP